MRSVSRSTLACPGSSPTMAIPPPLPLPRLCIWREAARTCRPATGILAANPNTPQPPSAASSARPRTTVSASSALRDSSIRSANAPVIIPSKPYQCQLRTNPPTFQSSILPFFQPSASQSSPEEYFGTSATLLFLRLPCVTVINATEVTMMAAAIKTRGVSGSEATRLPTKMAISGLT